MAASPARRRRRSIAIETVESQVEAEGRCAVAHHQAACIVEPPRAFAARVSVRQRDDGDGILDYPVAADKCPNKPEVYNGLDDLDGCPDEIKVEAPPPPKEYKNIIVEPSAGLI